MNRLRRRTWLGLALIPAILLSLAGSPVTAACGPAGASEIVLATADPAASCHSPADQVAPNQTGDCCCDAKARDASPARDGQAITTPGCACAIEAPAPTPASDLRSASIFTGRTLGLLPLPTVAFQLPELVRAATVHPATSLPRSVALSSTPSRAPPA